MNIRKDRKMLETAIERGVKTAAELAAYLRLLEAESRELFRRTPTLCRTF